MKVFKNNYTGFILIEVMLAMLIAGMTLTPLFIMQGNVLRFVGLSSADIERLFLVRSFFFDMQKTQPLDQKTFSKTKQIDRPKTTLMYELKPVSKRSSLKDIPGLFVERVTAKWSLFGLNKTQTFGMIVFDPERGAS